MTGKRWCLLALGMLLGLLFGVIALVVFVDPFEIYHRALFYNPPYESSTQMYSGAGVAKSYTYDSIIVGSSVTENCTPSVYDRALGGRFVKLSMNAGLSLDHAKMMDIAFRTHDVRRVVYGLDLFAFSQYYNNQKARTPDYLYDDNLFNDVYYLLNKNVLISYIPQTLAHIGKPDEDMCRDAMYYWEPPTMPGTEGLRRMIDLSGPMPKQKDVSRGLEMAQLSYEHNLLPYIKAHPETTFTFFFPPYSVYYWAGQAAEGMLDTAMAQRRLLGGMLLAEPNVELYDFHAHFDWVADDSLYYDLIHYISSVNDEMASAMAKGLCRVTDIAQIEENSAAIEQAAAALFP